MNKRIPVIVAIGALLLLFVYPFDVTATPEWNVKVVDENGSPVSGAYLFQGASHPTLGYDSTDGVCTNSNGEAQFPRRGVRASLVTRGLRWLPHALNPHGSAHPNVKVGAEAWGYGDMTDSDTMIAWDGSSNPVNSRFVLHKCPAGFTAYRCRFTYAYILEINGDTAESKKKCGK